MGSRNLILKQLKMSENSRSELIDHAKLCYEIKRSEYTVDCLKKVIKMGKPLNYEERQLLFRALCNKPKSLIKTWVSLRSHAEKSILANNLREKIRQEIVVCFDNSIKVLDDDLIKNDENVDAIVDYKSNKAAQYHSKMAFMHERNMEDEIRKTKELFEEALTIARSSLKASHPVRIWSALEFSYFYENICGSVEDALSVARPAYNKGISSLSDLDNFLHEEALKLLENLRAHIKELS